MRAALLVFALCAAGCMREPANAFTLTPGGNLKADARIVEQGMYAVSLRYPFANDAARRVAWEAAHARRDGAPFDVALTVTSPEGRVLIDRTIASPKLTSFSSTFLDAELVRLPMQPGRYVVAARTFNGTLPAEVPLQVSVAPAYQGK